MRRLLLLVLLALPALADESRLGTLRENVVTRNDPTESYTLFLPSIYKPGAQLPMLLVFDPRGRGTLGANLFREAAEEYGWIIMSSNGTQSDDGPEHNEKALKAMLPDIALYTPNPKRIYAAGFSGTAMLAWTLGIHSGGLAGVISSGGRLIDEIPPDKFSFANYGFSAEIDFNNRQMRRIDTLLERAGKQHNFRQFPGEHAWMDSTLGGGAVGWLELLAMKSGLRQRDDGIVARLFERDAAAAAAAEPLESLRILQSMVRTYDGLRDVAETRTAVARMAKDPAIRKLQAEEAKADQFEERFVRETLGSIGAIYAGLRQSEFKPTAADVRRALRVGDLQRMAAKDGAEGRAAKRLLASVFSQLAFYLRREFLARQEYQLGIISLQAAIEIHPERPVVWYNLGCLYALAGDRRHALDSIEKAISLGFNDAKLLASDQDLESIRDDARFKAALLAIPSQ